jgi:hypothetical protein
MSPQELWQLVEQSEETTPIAADERLDLEYAMKLLNATGMLRCPVETLCPRTRLPYIAEECNLPYDNIRMKVTRCLELAQSLV